MGSLANDVINVGSFGLIEDATGQEAAAAAAQGAAGLQFDAAMAGLDLNASQFAQTQANMQPAIDAANAATQQQMALTGLSGVDAQQQAFSQFATSPAQQFLQDRAQTNLLQNAAAAGGIGGGNVLSELVQQGVGFASQDFNNQFNRLGSIAGQGNVAAGNLGQFGAASANTGAGLLQAGGAAQASGLLGTAAANAAGTNQVLGIAGMVGGAMGGGAAGAGAAGGGSQFLQPQTSNVPLTLF